MILPRNRRLAVGLALALLAVARPAAADYVSQTVLLTSPADPVAPAGSVVVEAYDGLGTAGGGLNAGEVRISFQRIPPPRGAGHAPGEAPLFTVQGFQVVGFNTDLNLTAGQITGPAGWAAAPGVTLGGHGDFGWALGTATAFQNDVSVLITGLGANASLAHFLLNSTGGGSGPAQFAGQWIDVSFGPGGFSTSETVAGPAPEEVATEATPEPASLALGGLGLLGLAIGRTVRRRRQA